MPWFHSYQHFSVCMSVLLSLFLVSCLAVYLPSFCLFFSCLFFVYLVICLSCRLDVCLFVCLLVFPLFICLACLFVSVVLPCHPSFCLFFLSLYLSSCLFYTRFWILLSNELCELLRYIYIYIPAVFWLKKAKNGKI